METGIIIHNRKPDDLIHFSIVQSHKVQAIATLMTCLRNGQTVTLMDNRQRREGILSLKYIPPSFYRFEGGHGFHTERTEVSENQIVSLIKQVAVFNNGSSEESFGTIE